MNLYQTAAPTIDPMTQTQGAAKTSDKYGFISSQRIVSFFESQGFELDGTSYAKTKSEANQGFQKHIMVFSRPDLYIDDGNKIQILALNTHNGSSSLRLNVGVFRTVCANGLIAGDSIYEQRVRHVGNFEEKLKESLNYIVCNMGKLKEEVLLMKNTKLSFDAARSYLVSMARLRLKGVENLSTIDLSTVDKTRRLADKSNDLYTFFNRVQESVIKGGIKYTSEKPQFNEDKSPILGPNGETVFKTKNGTTRKIKEFKKTIELNKVLWSEALKLAA